MLDNLYIRITNNFLHDMATGTWAACVLVLWSLDSQLQDLPHAAEDALSNTMHLVFWFLLIALFVVSATGALRLLYWRSQTAREELHAKRRALIVKHLAFFIVFGGGTWISWTIVP